MSTQRLILLLFALAGVPDGFAGELLMPASAGRTAPVTVTYRTAPQATGAGELHLRWTDVYGRVVEDRTIAVNLADETEIRFPLDLRRAVAMQNELAVHFHFAGKNQKGEQDAREEDAMTHFVATPPDPAWWDYMSVMWQDQSVSAAARMKGVGINAGKSAGQASAAPAALLDNDLRFYVENIATDFYAAYHRFRADRSPNFDLLEAKAFYKKDPTSIDAFKRHPSLSDPQWLAKVAERAKNSARTYAPYRPLFYNLGDESGIAELAGLWDFDFSDYSLDGMREWLKQRYGSLDALNRQWSSHFTNWNEVTPDTTSAAMRRTDGNYSSWSDHKEWMDIAFADALKTGADAIRSVDPQAYVGIEGAQMPGWGGYDYARLSAALQAIEPYDIGNNIEIIRSLNPKMAFVTTAFERGPWEKHRIWYELLHGARGHIIWDEKYEVIGKNAVIGPRGTEAAPYWTELRDGVGALLMNSERQAGPIAIHYSQASMRSEWMQAQRPKGDAWLERMSWTERKDSEFLRLRESYCKLIEDQGLQYNFVSYTQVEDGELERRGYRVLILPRSSALSAAEAGAITSFVQQGGTLVIDGEAGIFDEHCRRLPQPALAALNGNTGRGRVVHLDALNYHQLRLVGKEAELYRAMEAILQGAGVQPSFRVTGANGKPAVGVEVHEFRNGGVIILGLMNNPQLSVDELGPPEFRSNQRFEKPQNVELMAPAEFYAWDVRRELPLGRVKRLSLRVDPYEPTLIAFSPVPISGLMIAAPARMARGDAEHAGISFATPSPAETHILHVSVLDPAGKLVEHYSGNLRATKGSAAKVLPLARNDAAGRWTIRVRDVLTGEKQTANFEVY